jgi:uncharacterized protein YcbK (DUF882 family)
VYFSNAYRNLSLKLPLRAAQRVGLAAILLVAASDGLQDAVANGDTRTLSFHHLHTRDTLTVTFKRNGQFDSAGLAKLNHFLRDWRNDHQIKMDPRLFDILWEVYQETGASRPIEIISAYRSPATNSMLRRRSRGVAKASQHTLGKAIDFNIPGVSLARVRDAGLRLQRGGVGFYPSSGSPFVHLDVGSVRHWPRLSPDALARVFPDGRTVHIPSNGRPMPGYALALADIARRGASPSPTTVAAATNAGVTATDVPQQSANAPGNWIARMFGRGEQPAAEAPARPRVREPAQAVAAAIPMPRSRPAASPEPRPMVVAAATAPAALPANSPSQIVASRGIWGAAERPAAEPPATTGSTGGPRMVWQVGAQPVATASGGAGHASVPAPRARPAERTVAAGAANVPWPVGTREDRVPSDLALAYAATAAVPAAEPAVRAAPMGALRATPARNRATREAAAPARATPAVFQPAPAARLAGNPWLRGVVLARSLHAAVGVTTMGPPNYLALTPLLHKPSHAVPNAFAADPQFGLSTKVFSGSAVAFVPAIDFRRITVGLK